MEATTAIDTTKLATKIAHRWVRPGVQLDDLTQEALLAAHLAAQQGKRADQIRNVMINACRTFVRKNVSIVDVYAKTEGKKRWNKNRAHPADYSLNTPIGDAEETFQDLLADEANPESLTAQQERHAFARELYASLSGDEQQIADILAETITDAEQARAIGITREGVRKRRNKTTRALRLRFAEQYDRVE